MNKLKLLVLGLVFPVMGLAQVLVVAPHPDDEILAVGETMQQKLAEGEEVYVVFVTDGEAHDEHSHDNNQSYAEIRRHESILAFESIGGDFHHALFLGFPDSHLADLNTQVLTSKYSKRTSTPSNTKYPNSAFTDFNLVQNLYWVVNEINPTEVYYTSPNDKHADHATVGRAMRDILLYHPAVGYEYTIHHKKGQKQKSEDYFSEPKLKMIGFFRSQFHSDYHRQYLENFAYFPERFEMYLPRF
jgi:LmbE family N-acetylglucosaminyl deacetylase